MFGGQRIGDESLDVGGAARAGDARHFAPTMHHRERRNGLDPVPAGKVRPRIGVQLDDQPASRMVSRETFELGSDHAARPAPGRPEVDHEGNDTRGERRIE